jgi:hypothetical protein
MAKRDKKDIGLNSKLDEIERSIFRIKVAYEKYFNGIERFEPLKELEDLKRLIRNMMTSPIRNTQQRYRFTQLKARLSSQEMYWKRNVSQMERGVHPKQVFRANLKESNSQEAQRLQRERRENQKMEQQMEERRFRSVYDQLVDARRQTGQSTDISFDSVKSTLKKQSRMIKSKFKCDDVQFRVEIQNGKPKMKAVPVKRS